MTREHTDRLRARLAAGLEVVAYLEANGIRVRVIRVADTVGDDDVSVQVERAHTYAAARALGLTGPPTVRGDVDRCIATYNGEWHGWRVHLFGPIDLADLYERRPVDVAAAVDGHGPASWRNAEGDIQ